MLAQIEDTPWGRYAQPEWNDSASVSSGLRLVFSATDAASSAKACEKLLYALGNSHAGTYYPVVLPILNFLGECLRTGNPWAQRTTLCLLDDLFASFQPEPGFETFTAPNGQTTEVAAEFRAKILSFQPILKRMLAAGDPNSSLAGDVLALLPDNAA